MTRGTVLLALVANPSTEQRVVHVERLGTDIREVAPAGVSDFLCAAMERLPLPEASHPITHAVVTVVVRAGRTVLGRYERDWMVGWLFINHHRPAFTGDLILVTEHGWLDATTGWADHWPRMEATIDQAPRC